MNSAKVEVDEWLVAIRDLLLADGTLSNILGGAGRVYLAEDFAGEPEDREDRAWARVVIIPATTLWQVEEKWAEFRNVNFLVRVDANNFDAPGFRVRRVLEGAQSRVWDLLAHRVILGMQRCKQATPLFRFSAPQPLPGWLDREGTWFMSAEWRAALTA